VTQSGSFAGAIALGRLASCGLRKDGALSPRGGHCLREVDGGDRRQRDMGGGLRAISARSAADILSALPRPPFRPRLRPSVTARISFNPIVSAASSRFSRCDWGKSSRCKRSARHSPSEFSGRWRRSRKEDAHAEARDNRRGRRSSGSPLHYVLFALPPVTSRRMPGVISFTPLTRDPVER
jgi:hypothetical protein